MDFAEQVAREESIKTELSLRSGAWFQMVANFSAPAVDREEMLHAAYMQGVKDTLSHPKVVTRER